MGLVSGLKSFFLPLVEPVGLLWLILLLGTIWACWRRHWKSALWVGIPMALLYLFAATPLTEALVAQAERPYARLASARLDSSPWAGAEAVVCLGGGFYPSDHDVFGFALAGAGSRLLSAVELVRVLKPKALVLGGSLPLSDGPETVTSARVQQWIQSWNLAEGLVTNLGICADTHDEAVQFKKLQDVQHWQRVILVTSALHMRRSEATFLKEGVPVIPFACDFQACGVSAHSAHASPFPSESRLLKLSLYVHEKIGWLAYRWRGWI